MAQSLKNGSLAVIFTFVCVVCYQLGLGFRELTMRYGDSVDLVFIVASCPTFTLGFAAEKVFYCTRFLGLVFAVGAVLEPCYRVVSSRLSVFHSRWTDAVIRNLFGCLVLGLWLTVLLWHGANQLFLRSYFDVGLYGLCLWEFNFLKDLVEGGITRLFLVTQVLLWGLVSWTSCRPVSNYSCCKILPVRR